MDLNTHRKIISFVEKEYKEEDNGSCRNGCQFHGDFDGKKEIDSFLNMFLKNILKMVCLNHRQNNKPF